MKNSLRNFIQTEAKANNLSYVELAKSCKVSASYFSRFMNQTGRLSNSQVFLLAEKLKLSADEADRLVLLNEIETADSAAYREKLEKKLNPISKAPPLVKTKTSQTLASVEYYTNPTLQVVHMAFEVPKYQTNLRLLAERLVVTVKEAQVFAEKLVTLGQVEKIGENYFARRAFVHLEHGDFLSYQNHQIWRVHALKKINQNDELTSQFSATIAGNKSTYLSFRNKFRQLIADYSKELNGVKSEMVYQINMDLFSLI